MYKVTTMRVDDPHSTFVPLPSTCPSRASLYLYTRNTLPLAAALTRVRPCPRPQSFQLGRWLPRERGRYPSTVADLSPQLLWSPAL